MKLNVNEISAKLLEGEVVTVKETSLNEDMTVMHEYYEKTPNKPEGIEDYLELNPEGNPIELAKIYFKLLTGNNDLAKVEKDGQLVNIQL